MLDAVDGSFGKPCSAVSNDTFEEATASECKYGLDIIMPNLSIAGDDFASAPGVDTVPWRPQDPSTAKKVLIHNQSSLKHVDDTDNIEGATSVEGRTTIAQSSSCASNLSTDVTIKTGNILFRRGGGIVSASMAATSSSDPGKYRPRSASCSSSAKDAGDANDSTAATSIMTKRRSNTNNFKSPDKHYSSQDPTAATPAQTMKEYVMNDLLNIDSRNQDGSATEDVDENMEEFLRVPPKLEGLMFFSLAVCIDSFLYVWAMLPLKFVWGVICLACSAYSPKKGVRGVKFHRR